MNKNKLLIAVVLASSLTWAGCNKSGKLADRSTFKPPSGPVELKLKWPQGEKIVMDMDTKMNMEIFLPNQPNSMKQDMTLGQKYGLTVLKETPDGGHEVEMEFLSARMELAMGGKTLLNFDSTKRAPDDKANPVAGQVNALFQNIIGSKIQYFLNASNDVDRIEGVDELVGRLSPGGPADQLATFKSTMFSKDRFKQMMSTSRFLPPKAVQPGDTWPIKQNLEMGPIGVLDLNFDCTFSSWEMHGNRNCARIEFQGTLKSTPGTNANPAGISMSILDGNCSGVSWFDPELGLTIDTTMNQDMKMSMTIPISGRGNAPARTQTMTNILNQVVTVKLDSVK